MDFFQHSIFRPTTWFNPADVAIEVDLPTTTTTVAPAIVLIHGANASTLSYAYLRSKLPEYTYINVDYNSKHGFYNNLQRMVELTKDAGHVYIIGHSLGGIYAMHLSQQIDAVGGVTIAAPHAGSRTADWARYMAPGYRVFSEVGSRSAPIIEAKQFTLPGIWTNLVSTAGNVPWHGSKNDGVLTCQSMADRDIPTISIDATHYEIVCHNDTIKHITSELQTLTS